VLPDSPARAGCSNASREAVRRWVHVKQRPSEDYSSEGRLVVCHRVAHPLRGGLSDNTLVYGHGGSGVRVMNRLSIITVKSPIVTNPSVLRSTLPASGHVSGVSVINK
jgi:hypothetical protein